VSLKPLYGNAKASETLRRTVPLGLSEKPSHDVSHMKKAILFVILIPACAPSFLLFLPLHGSQAQTSIYDIYVGTVGGTTFLVPAGPPNSTINYNITQTNPGVMGYALQQPPPSGPWADSLIVPVSFDASGNGSGHYFFFGKTAGATDQNTCSPQLGCTADSPIHWTVTPPASEAKIQYLKDGAFVDVPATLNVVKNDMLTFKAIPSPAGSRFYPNEPRWGGTSGATGQGETTSVTFNTLSKNTHDYKTVTANVTVSTISGGVTTTANVIVADGVTSISLEKIDPASILDDNPNAGGGKRTFPDKNSPSDTVNRKKVRVKVLTSFGAGQTIYFKSFDLDDPSTDAAPVDSNGSAGNDNRGGSGTSQQFGILSPVGGSGTTNSVSAATDANGLASADLMVTMQPGDNFMVAASHDQKYLNGLTVNGILLQDSSGNLVGSGTPKAKTSPMLTVWRRVHVEADSMDIVPTTGPQQNYVTGKITSINGTSTMATLAFIDQNLNDGSRKLDDPPPNTGTGRFQSGTIRIGTTGNVTETADLLGNGTNYLEKDTGNGIVIPCTVSKSGETDVNGNVISLISNVVKIGITGGTLTANFAGGTIRIGGMSMTITAVNDTDSSVTIDALADIPIELVDDDDFNSNDASSLRGDQGEDVVALTQTFSRMQESDDPTANVYAPAYIRPVYDGGGSASNNNGNVSFVLNVANNTTGILNQINLGRSSGANESDNFWVAYVQVAYQPEALTDFDPNTESSTGGYTIVNGDTDDVSSSAGVPIGGDGSLVFIETMRDRVRFPGSILDTITAPHEVGHQFGLKGDAAGFGIMFNSSEPPVFVDRHLNVLRWRVKSPGQP